MVGVRFDTVLGSTHVVEQLSFAMFLSILTSDFDLISGLFTCFIIICLNIIVKKNQQNGHILVVLPRKEKINSLYLSQSAFILIFSMICFNSIDEKQ